MFRRVGEDERLTNDHAAGFAVDVLIKRTAVDFDLAGAALHEDASNGALAAARAVVVISNHFLDLKLFGLLGGVFMVAAGINEELLEHGIAKRALRKHAFNCDFESTAGMLFLHLTESGLIYAAGVAGVTEILLVFSFSTGHDELVSVDNNDVIARVDVRCVFRLVFATESESDFSGKAADNLIGCINHVPFTLTSSGLAEKVFITIHL